MLSAWLAARSNQTRHGVTLAASFGAYFCMYAFRKPFAAASYDASPAGLAGAVVTLKTLYVVSQILGYACSKYLGVWVCSSVGRRMRWPLLMGLIVAAEAALIAFGAVPDAMPLLKALALFANGLPLGMVWGLVVLYLEGRRVSEVLLTGMSCSYIVASGVVKDVGRAVLAGDPLPLPLPDSVGLAIANPLPPIPEYWMPAAVGMLFLLPFALATWVLESVPEPDQEDIDERSERVPMTPADRRRFLAEYGAAISAALIAYLGLTAFRDYRDNYAVEAFTQLGYDYASHKSVVSQAELIVAFAVMAIVCQLHRFRDNRRGLVATHIMMISGMLLIGGATAFLDSGLVTGFWWMVLTGLGAYLAYVPFGSVLFDRAIACTRFTGTAVFGIYLADAVGYTGSVAFQLGKDVLLREAPHATVLRGLGYTIAAVGSLALMVSCQRFTRRSQKQP